MMKKILEKYLLSYLKTLKRDYLLRKKVINCKDGYFKEINSKVLNELEVVTVLSTGRCGTLYLTELLENNLINLDIYHKPKPEFFNLNNELYHNRFNAKKLKDIYLYSRFDRLKEAYLLNRQFIETSCKTTFLATGIDSAVKNTKFIHLIRNPYRFCESALSRNYYNSHYANQSRIFPKDEDKPYWNSLTLIEKNIWNWVETNLYIEEFKSNSTSPILTLKSEDLFRNNKERISLINFISGNDNCQLVKRGRKVRNKGKTSKIKVTINDIRDPDLKKALLILCKRYNYV